MTKKKSKEKQGIIEIIAQAAIDIDFRKRLLSDPEAIAKAHGLSELDSVALANLTNEELDKAAKGLSLRADWWIGIGIRGTFSVKDDTRK